MANKRKDNSAGTRIRHYVYGLLRKSGNVSVKLPSSYELAEMFGTTRRVARYELERLISEDVLISKPRIGTFTNPRKNHINITPIQKKMPLIGIIDGDGQRFCYGCAENLIYCHMGLALTKHKCYVHHISFSCVDNESRIQELKNLGLDGILWHIPHIHQLPKSTLVSDLEAAGVPIVVITPLDRGYRNAVVLSTGTAETELAEVFQREKRQNFLALTNLTIEVSIAASILDKMGLPGETLRNLNSVAYFQDKIVAFRELLASGYRPDAIFCDPLFAETIPDILKEFDVDLSQQCRLVACNELNSEENFQGYIISPDAAGAADVAASLLIEAGKEQNNGPFKRAVQCKLKEIK